MVKNNNNEAMNELVRRFMNSSKKLARKTLLEFKMITKAEYDDLVSIGMCTFLSCIKKYDGCGSLFLFWKNTAYYDMITYIKDLSMVVKVDGHFINVTDIENGEEDWMFSSGESIPDSVGNSLLIEKMFKILHNPRYRFTKTEKLIFAYYLNGYSIQEIADELGMKYHNVRVRFYRIADQIANILKYSKE